MMEARELLTLAGDCGYPAVAVGRTVVHGEMGWQHACLGIRPAVPRERLVLLAGLRRPLLVASTPGRARLRAWCARQRTRSTMAKSGDALWRQLADTLAYFGDPTMLDAVVEAFVTLPRPVREALVDEVAWLGVGLSLDGFMTSSELAP